MVSIDAHPGHGFDSCFVSWLDSGFDSCFDSGFGFDCGFDCGCTGRLTLPEKNTECVGLILARQYFFFFLATQYCSNTAGTRAGGIALLLARRYWHDGTSARELRCYWHDVTVNGTCFRMALFIIDTRGTGCGLRTLSRWWSTPSVGSCVTPRRNTVEVV